VQAWLTVKEQMPDLYAARLVARGFLAVTAGFAGFGASGGGLRQTEIPNRKMRNLAAVVGWLRCQSGVDGDRIGVLAACASAHALEAAMVLGISDSSLYAAFGTVPASVRISGSVIATSSHCLPFRQRILPGVPSRVQVTDMDEQFWNERYGSQAQLFSGNPNGVLVAEVAELAAGQALDVGCGEGGDAMWLARRGWRVTAVDISRVALERAAAAGADVADRITWTRADLTVAPPPAGSFDLVSVQYFPLPRQPDHAALRRLLAAVAPGGRLLVAGHDLADLPPEHESEFDPAAFYQPSQIAALLDEHWTVLVDETRPRTAPAPPGTHHAHDTVLLARRN
jgi:SAM-dependent methyltransferase